jgi:thiamine biosynthesis lipoprotein
LSTSGDYENYFEVEGRRYSHVLDPRSGLPAANVAAVSLTAPTCAESDALATACFVLGPSPSLARFGDRFGMKFSIPPRSETESWIFRKSELFPEEQHEHSTP